MKGFSKRLHSFWYIVNYIIRSGLEIKGDYPVCILPDRNNKHYQN